jgi:hypothetical protein
LASVEQNELETYRVIVLDRSGTEVLLVPNGQYHILPRVEVPRWQRVAENLTTAIKSEWGQEVVGLFELPATNSGTLYFAAESLRLRRDSDVPTRWVPISALGQDSLEPRDYAAIDEVSKVSKGEIGGAFVGPFARPGWFCDLRNWIDSVIEPMGFHANGEFRQLNASASFILLRFEADGTAVWFKAVGEPNLKEFAITCALAQLFPDYLPPMLGTRPDWNGWLSREIQGKLLSEIQEQASWERTAAALARLQVESVGRGLQILGAGAHHLSSMALSRLIEPFVNVVAQLMQRQTKVPPAVLDSKDLLALTESLQSAVDATEATGIPETLGHLDLNPGNIVISEKRCAFLDWAEAYIGNPLFSLEYLLQHARRTLGVDSQSERRIVTAYSAQWDGIISPAAIVDALSFAPLLAVFAYAVGNDTWRQAASRQEPAAAGYLRSLARRMQSEAQSLLNRGTGAWVKPRIDVHRVPVIGGVNHAD